MHLGPMLTYKGIVYLLNQKVKLMDLVWMMVYLLMLVLVMLGLLMLLWLVYLTHPLPLVAIGKRSPKFNTRKKMRPGV